MSWLECGACSLQQGIVWSPFAMYVLVQWMYGALFVWLLLPAGARLNIAACITQGVCERVAQKLIINAWRGGRREAEDITERRLCKVCIHPKHSIHWKWLLQVFEQSILISYLFQLSTIVLHLNILYSVLLWLGVPSECTFCLLFSPCFFQEERKCCIMFMFVRARRLLGWECVAA